MAKLLVLGLVMFLVVACIGYVYCQQDIEIENDDEDNVIYSGPVRLNDNLTHFRETGITKEVDN